MNSVLPELATEGLLNDDRRLEQLSRRLKCDLGDTGWTLRAVSQCS
jgi:hypothetical protein